MRSRKLLAAVGCVASLSGSALAAPQTFKLRDHPDGNANPPPYGLRMDGLFNGIAGAGFNSVTSFSFNTHNDVFLHVDDTGSNIKITMFGTVYGGVDVGGVTGFGAGSYQLFYEMTVNVGTMGTGWLVTSPSNGVNRGYLKAQAGIVGIAAGTTFNFYESNSMGNPFKFLQDEHRLTTLQGGAANYPEAGQNFWVGRGWNTTNSNGSPTTLTQDWLFLGSLVPLPSAAGLGLGALLGLPLLRRRR